MYKKTEKQLLEEAYISVTKKTPYISTDKEKISMQPNEVVSSGPVTEPAPGVDMDMISSEVTDVEPEDKDTTGVPVSIAAGGMESSMTDPRMSEEDENEEDSMAIQNLHSIRESILKIAAHCAKGDHLEPWMQQKLAIAMDNLAEVARRLC
jgi:hypothetical protein